MTTHELQQEILRLKKEKNVCILAHAYQSQAVLEVADYTGDSYGLSVQAAKTDAAGVIMCGVRFMAETCKILSPEKTVWLANPMAGCPMAEQLDLPALRALKAQYPGYATVAYINTTSALKTECDVGVHGGQMIALVEDVDGAFQLPVHAGGVGHQTYPAAAELLVHPECRAEVVAQADYVGSTTGIMAYAKKSAAREFIIGTENSIVEHLSFDCPDKSFYPLAVQLTCMNMKLTTLPDIYRCLLGTGGEQITLPADIMAGAGRCIRRMVELGG